MSSIIPTSKLNPTSKRSARESGIETKSASIRRSKKHAERLLNFNPTSKRECRGSQGLRVNLEAYQKIQEKCREIAKLQPTSKRSAEGAWIESRSAYQKIQENAERLLNSIQHPSRKQSLLNSIQHPREVPRGSEIESKY
jgi:hypothetical protein